MRNTVMSISGDSYRSHRRFHHPKRATRGRRTPPLEGPSAFHRGSRHDHRRRGRCGLADLRRQREPTDVGRLCTHRSRERPRRLPHRRALVSQSASVRLGAAAAAERSETVSDAPRAKAHSSSGRRCPLSSLPDADSGSLATRMSRPRPHAQTLTTLALVRRSC